MKTFLNYKILMEKYNFSSLTQLAQSAQFYLLNSHFNQKSEIVKMCKKLFYTFLPGLTDLYTLMYK